MPLRVPKLFFVLGSIFGLSTLISTSCVQVDYPDIAFRCNPAKDGSDACPDDYMCCSDDPTAYDGTNAVAAGVLPAYQNSPGGTGQPIFSGDNNALSSSGMCIRNDLLPPGVGLTEAGAQNCPIPCNPAWDAASVSSVCGSNSLCCQTVELETSDCVFDSNANCFRPVTGQDIQTSGIERIDDDGVRVGPVNWAAGDHDTMQDPNGTNCKTYAAGDSSAQTACFRALNVASARGFCLTRSASVTACPLVNPAYIDPCEELNAQNGGLSCS